MTDWHVPTFSTWNQTEFYVSCDVCGMSYHAVNAYFIRRWKSAHTNMHVAQARTVDVSSERL